MMFIQHPHTVIVSKKHGRPKKMKLMDHTCQTVVTTPATSSSVIKDTSSCTNNSSGVEEVCTNVE